MVETITSRPTSAATTYPPAIQNAISLGNKEYAIKNYEKAVEYYGEASERQYQPSKLSANL